MFVVIILCIYARIPLLQHGLRPGFEQEKSCRQITDQIAVMEFGRYHLTDSGEYRYL